METFDSIIPQTTEGFGSEPLSVLVNQLFWAGLAVAVVLAVVMIVTGGVQYMTIDSWSEKDSGKKRVQAALGGLVLAFAAVLILNTINPGITSLQLTFPGLSKPGVTELGDLPVATPQNNTGGNAQTPDSGFPTQGYVPPTTASRSETEVRNFLSSNGISINNSPCVGGNTRGCTNVAGLGEAAMIGVVNLKNASGGVITITGGTEDGHKTHGVGKPILDLRRTNATLNKYITDNSTRTYKSGSYTVYVHANGTTFMDENDHWHVVFK